MSSFARRLWLPVAVLAMVVFLPGCGVSLEGASSSGDSGPVARTTAGQDAEQQAPTLPRRPAGVVRIEGKAQGSLTDSLIEAYGAGGSSANFDVRNSAEARAFEAFCAGVADVVDSARPISPSEYAACQANGIEPVQLQVASDAAVLAIENETDVGVDCLSLTDVREMFRAASPVTNWSQVGYGERAPVGVDALPIKIAGPDARSNVFGFFGRFVLGDPEPSPILLRSDYQAFPTDHGVRLAVAGSRAERDRAARGIESLRSAKDLEAAYEDAADALDDALFQVEKGIEDGRPATAQALDAERLAAAEAKLAELGEELEVAELRAHGDEVAAARVAQRYGTLGLFRFTYYELWEERLRPMEIEASGAGGPECIFPSESTVTDASYPLSRQLLLTVDLEAMREAEINDFLSFAVANSGREAIENALVPLPDEVRNTELSWLRGDTAPDVVYYPPSQDRRGQRRGKRLIRAALLVAALLVALPATAVAKPVAKPSLPLRAAPVSTLTGDNAGALRLTLRPLKRARLGPVRIALENSAGTVLSRLRVADPGAAAVVELPLAKPLRPVRYSLRMTGRHARGGKLLSATQQLGFAAGGGWAKRPRPRPVSVSRGSWSTGTTASGAAARPVASSRRESATARSSAVRRPTGRFPSGAGREVAMMNWTYKDWGGYREKALREALYTTGTGEAFNEGLNKFGPPEKTSTGSFEGLISDRGPIGGPGGAPLAAPMTISLSWQWDFSDPASSRCHVEAVFRTEAAATSPPLARSAQVLWRGEANAAANGLGAIDFPGLGEVAVSCRPGEPRRLTVASPSGARIVTREGSEDGAVHRPGPVSAALPNNGMVVVEMDSGERIVVASRWKLNDPDPELNWCAIAAQVLSAGG